MLDCALLAAALVLAPLQAGNGPATHAAGQNPPPTFRLLQVSAGPSGTTSRGEYRLDEQRTVFNRIADSQVVVYFQWEGAPGAYKLAGRWRGPSGLSTSSEFEYRATTPRFGAYWVLPLSRTTPLGQWTLDALIDGVPAGSLSIEVVDASGGPPPPAPHPLLSQAELYDRLEKVFVSLDSSQVEGYLAAGRGGVLLAPNVLATSFTSIDAAGDLTAVLPDGRRAPLTAVRAWSRTQDWAILPVATSLPRALPAAEEQPRIGDRCFSLSGMPGGRALAECGVTGRATAPGGGPRLIVEFATQTPPPGSPVVDQDGQLIGLIGGGLTPGLTSLGVRFDLRASSTGTVVVPLSLVADTPTSAGTSFQDLRQQRVLRDPVSGRDHVMSAGTAAGVQRDQLRPLDQREVFTGADKKIVAFITWDPKQRLRGMMQLRCSTVDNVVVSDSKPTKVDFKVGSPVFSDWELPVPAASGWYYVDILIDGRVMSREAFRVTR